MDEVGKRMRLERLYSHPHQALRASFSHRVKPFTRRKTQFTLRKQQFMRPTGVIHDRRSIHARLRAIHFFNPSVATRQTPPRSYDLRATATNSALCCLFNAYAPFTQRGLSRAVTRNSRCVSNNSLHAKSRLQYRLQTAFFDCLFFIDNYPRLSGFIKSAFYCTIERVYKICVLLHD